MPFPTDLASFLDLIRQHGSEAYSFMFAYAASHSLLFGLFAGYAAHSGALDLATLIVIFWLGSFVGDVVRFWIGRRFGTRWFKSFPRLERLIHTAARLADKHYLLMILFHRYPHGIRGVAAFAYGISRLPWSTFLALNFVAAGIWSCRRGLDRLCLRPHLGEADERRLLRPRHGHADPVPRAVLVFEQKTRTHRRAQLRPASS